MELEKYLVGLYFKCKNNSTSYKYFKKILTLELINYNNVMEHVTIYLDNFCKNNNYASYKLYSCDVYIHNTDNEHYMKTIYF